jgi:hypothetical protein
MTVMCCATKAKHLALIILLLTLGAVPAVAHDDLDERVKILQRLSASSELAKM